MMMKSVEELSDSDLEGLVQRLSREVLEKQDQVKTLKTEIDGVREEIKKQQHERAGFTKQLFQAEQVAPLVEQCLQLRQSLSERSNHFQAVSQGTSDSHSEIERLERQLCEVESGQTLSKMEKENRAVAISLQELKDLHAQKVKEHGEIEDKLTKMRLRIAKLRAEQANRTTPHRQLSHQQQSMDTKLDRFIWKCCKQSGVQLHPAK